MFLKTKSIQGSDAEIPRGIPRSPREWCICFEVSKYFRPVELKAEQHPVDPGLLGWSDRSAPEVEVC